MKIEMSEDTEESVEEMERLMMMIRKEMNKGKEREGMNVEKWVKMAIREVKGIKAEMSMLPKESKVGMMMGGNVDAYEKELESVMMRLSDGDNSDNCGSNSSNNKQRSSNTCNTQNDVCMLLKQPHIPKPHHTTIPITNTSAINTKRIILLLSLLLLFLITYILYTYIFINTIK